MSVIMLAMVVSHITHPVGLYTVTTPLYEGPFELLLRLIEKSELDITKLALAHITDQYLEHLKTIQEHTTAEVSAFLVIAAKLIQIKSEVLLPHPPTSSSDEDEDIGEALTRQLIEYKRFKTIANHLAQREGEGLRTYLRLAPPVKIETVSFPDDIDIDSLIAIAKSLYSDGSSDYAALDEVVSAPKITIREKIHWITYLMRRRGKVKFHAMLEPSYTRFEITVTFLALLELIKRHLVRAIQEGLFGEIELEPVETWDENEEFDLEFEEQ